MMTQEKFIELAREHLPTGVKAGETNESVAKRLVAEGMASIVAEARRSGLVKGIHDQIADRAYAIWQATRSGTAEENWAKAEAEIRAGK